MADDLSGSDAEFRWALAQDGWWKSEAACRMRLDGILVVRLAFHGEPVCESGRLCLPRAVAVYKNGSRRR